jgi:hypothetical protein
MRKFSVAILLTLTLNMFFATVNKTDKTLPVTVLVMGERVITIDNSSQGLLYSVKTKDGHLLDTSLNEAQMEARYPDLYQSVRPAIASNESQENMIMMWDGVQGIPSEHY